MIKIALGSIAGFSLFVSGIGIMNICLVSVGEKTREIGLRKSVGAKQIHIFLQFLTESICLCFCGGVLGIAGGWGAAHGMARLAVRIVPVVSVSQLLLIGGVPDLKGSGLNTIPASGMYIDELRISRVVRYGVGKYDVPTKAFVSDDDTLGLYHFDEKSTERYEDASPHQIPLIRVKKNTESRSIR